MSSILDTPLLNPSLSSLSSLSSLVDPPTDFIGTFGLDSLYPLGTGAPIHPFQSPSSSSSDNDFSSPPTSPESPPPPTSALPLTLKPEVDTTWVGTMDTTLTDVSLMTPILSGYQLKPVPTNARKRRTTTNRKTVRGGRGRAGRGSVKSILASPPHLPPTPLSTALPISPSPAKLVKSDSESYPIIATPIEGGVPVEESQLRQLLHDHVLKEKRLKRKAELARLSRKKKQLRMSDLEKQNQALLEENQRLLQQNAMLLAERGKVVYKQEAKVIQKAPLQPTVSAPPTAKSKSLESHIHAINELFTKNGDLPAYQVPLDDSQVAQLIGGVSESFKQLTGSLESSLKQIGETLVPCTVMQFLEWTLMQREKFYQEENGLFMSLFRDEMKATPTQIAQLLKLRTQMQQQSIKMKDQVLVDAFHAFEKVLLQRGRLQQPDVFEQLRMIFTPRQLATYFRYVSQYGSVLIKVPV